MIRISIVVLVSFFSGYLFSQPAQLDKNKDSYNWMIGAGCAARDFWCFDWWPEGLRFYSLIGGYRTNLVIDFYVLIVFGISDLFCIIVLKFKGFLRF